LRKFNSGDVIDFLFITDDAAKQVSSSLESDGHQVLAIEERDKATKVSVRKAG
jgi:TusA-related sulfurtransferase